MPKPRKTLDVALGRVAPETTSTRTSRTKAKETGDAPSASNRKPPAAGKGRRASAKMSVYLSEEVHRQLREIAHVEYPTKLNDLILEGIDRVFKDRGRPSIAELNRVV